MKFSVDEEVCAVLIKMVVRGGEVMKECEVRWTNGEAYAAKVLAAGKSNLKWIMCG